MDLRSQKDGTSLRFKTELGSTGYDKKKKNTDPKKKKKKKTLTLSQGNNFSHFMSFITKIGVEDRA